MVRVRVLVSVERRYLFTAEYCGSCGLVRYGLYHIDIAYFSIDFLAMPLLMFFSGCSWHYHVFLYDNLLKINI